MANPNYWSERDSADSGDDDPKASSDRSSYARSEQTEPAPAPKTEQLGVIYHRMPLPPEIVQPANLGKPEKADDDEEEDEDEVRQTAAATPAAAATEAEQPQTEQSETTAVELITAEADTEEADAEADDTRPAQPVRPVRVTPRVARDAEGFATVNLPTAAELSRTAQRDAVVGEDDQVHPLETDGPAPLLPPAEQLLQPAAVSAPAEYVPVLVAPTAAEVPLAEQPGFGGVAPLPPIQRFNSPNQFVHPPSVLAEQPTQAAFSPDLGGGNSYQYDHAPATPLAAPERPVIVEARDRRLVPAVLTAVGFEYFARKRADRKLEKRMTEAATERQRETAQSYQRVEQQQQQFGEHQQRQAAELQQLRTTQERAAETPLTYAEPQPRRFQPERPLPPIIAAPEQRPATPTAPAEQAPIIIQPEQPQEVPHTREQQDAWRRYVVDEHNREVVTARTYGEAYHQERQQEIIRDNTAGSAGGDAAGGGAFGMGYGSPSGTPSAGPGLPSGMTTPSLPQGTPTHADPQHQLAAGSEKEKDPIRSNVSNPWFWLMLALIVAAFFTATLI